MHQDGFDRYASDRRTRRLSPTAWAVAPSPEFLIGGSAGSWLTASSLARATPPRRPAAVMVALGVAAALAALERLRRRDLLGATGSGGDLGCHTTGAGLV